MKANGLKGTLSKLPVNRYLDALIFLFLLAFPLFANLFRVELMGRIVVYVIFALSLDLLWGYTGLMSFGHAVLFGLGGYVVGISMTIQNGVPDFMERMGVTELPAAFELLSNLQVSTLLGILIPGILAALLGYFIFTSKVSGIFFSLITLALSQIFETFFANQTKFTNGTNGLGGLTRSLFGVSLKLKTLYYIIVIVCIAVYVFCLFLSDSRFGKVLQSVRENEARLTFLGYKPARFKIAIYAISGMIAGLAGVLYVPINNFISPTELGITLSTSVLIWVAIGGRGNLTGAMLGALLVNWMQTLLSEYSADIWPLVIGAGILLVIFLIPTGIVGKLIELQYNFRTSRTMEKLIAKEEGEYASSAQND